MDSSAQIPSVPSVASGFVKAAPSASNMAVYNDVATKLMVCLTILATG